jgi:hypothetical protein
MRVPEAMEGFGFVDIISNLASPESADNDRQTFVLGHGVVFLSSAERFRGWSVASFLNPIATFNPPTSSRLLHTHLHRGDRL